MKLLILCLALTTAQATPAQTPAQPPSTATGICKDGSFTSEPQRDNACHGHKGLKSWYNPGVPALPAPALASLPTVPAPTDTPASHVLPIPTMAAMPSLPTPATASTSTLPAPTPSPIASRPAPTVTTTAPTLPTPQPNKVDVKYGIATERSRLLAGPPAPGGGPGLVWLNPSTKVYHCPASDYYGKTKNGTYLPEADAKAQGGHPNRNKPCI